MEKKKSKKRTENRKKKALFEDDFAFDEGIDENVINQLNFEDLYENSIKNSEVPMKETEMTKDQIKELETKMIKLDNKIINLEEVIEKNNKDLEKVSPINLLPTNHSHDFIFIPKIPNNQIKSNDELFYLRYLSQFHQLELMKLFKFNSFESFISNELFQNECYKKNFKSILGDCFNNGNLELLQFEFRNQNNEIILVFCLNPKRTMYLALQFDLLGKDKVIDQFKNDHVYVWKEFKIKDRNDNLIKAYTVLQNLNLNFIERFYFSCSCVQK